MTRPLAVPIGLTVAVTAHGDEGLGDPVARTVQAREAAAFADAGAVVIARRGGRPDRGGLCVRNRVVGGCLDRLGVSFARPQFCSKLIEALISPEGR